MNAGILLTDEKETCGYNGLNMWTTTENIWKLVKKYTENQEPTLNF